MKESRTRKLQFSLGNEYTKMRVLSWLKRRGWLQADVELVNIGWDADGDRVVTVSGPPRTLDRLKHDTGGRWIDDITGEAIDRAIDQMIEG